MTTLSYSIESDGMTVYGDIGDRQRILLSGVNPSLEITVADAPSSLSGSSRLGQRKRSSEGVRTSAASAVTFPSASATRTASGGLEWTTDHVRLVWTMRPLEASAWHEIQLIATNVSDAPIRIGEVRLFGERAALGQSVPFEIAWRSGSDLLDLAALVRSPSALESHNVLGLAKSDGSNATVIGWHDHRRGRGRIKLDQDSDGRAFLTPIATFDGMSISPGNRASLSSWIIGRGDSLSELMNEYGRLSARRSGTLVGPALTGWCSWYYYYDTLTASDLWDNVDTLSTSKMAAELDVIQIDDGWNRPGDGRRRVWGDWEAGALFPDGMANAAHRIHDAGFSAGLWLAPFSVDPESDLAAAHPEWMVQGESGPVDAFGCFALDLTHPGALGFLRETFRRVFDWGFDYVKLDFMVHALVNGRRYDPGLSLTDAFRAGLSTIRAEARDRFILGCGAPFSPCLGLVDAMRIGYDVSSRWDVRVNEAAWPAGNLNIRAAALQTIWHSWMHRTWWINDPDCLMVRDRASEPELENVGQHFPDAVDDPPHGLSEAEARFWVNLVWITGGLTLLGEKLSALTGTRRDLLGKAFPVNSAETRVVDFYEVPDVALIRSTRPGMIGCFSTGEEPVHIRVDGARCGLPETGALVERITGRRLEYKGGVIRFPVLEPHDGLVWIMEEE